MDIDKKLAAQLRQGLETLEIELDDAVQQRILAYLALLIKWNRAYNLVADAPDDVLLARHCLDSLAMVPHLKGKRLLDVGSGAGLPGCLLAIAAPKLQVTLCEPREKRVQFLQQCEALLELDNITVVQERIENYHPTKRYDMITSRAFTALAEFAEVSQHCLAKDGVFIAMKGPKVTEEIEDLPKSAKVLETFHYQVPGIEGERNITILR